MSFFKKRDLSDKSNDGEEAKRIRENDSLSSLSDEVFSDGLNSPVQAKLFFNCLRNIENQVLGTFWILVLFKGSWYFSRGNYQKPY